MAEARKSLMTSSFELFFCWVLVAHKSCIICRLATYLLASHSHLVSENYCRWNWMFSHNFFFFRMLWEWQLKIGRTRSWSSQRISSLKGRGTSGTNLWRWDGEISFAAFSFLSRIQSVRSPTYSLHLWWYLLITFSNSNNRAHKIYAAIKQLK